MFPTSQRRFIYLLLLSLSLHPALVPMSEYTLAQRATTEPQVWDVKLAPDTQTNSNLTVNNTCRKKHRFTITLQNLPYLRFLAAPTVTISGRRSQGLPVIFDTTGVKPGEYPGTVLVKCDTCHEEPTCRQDRETIPVRLTVIQTAPTPLVSISGRVVDPRNRPIRGVEVRVPEHPTVSTNARGEFTLSRIPSTERLAVSFTSQDYMNTTRILRARAGQGTQSVPLWPRAKAVSLDAERGGKVRFPNGGGVTLPPNALVDDNGQPVRGKVKVRLTSLDVSDRKQLRAVPGDFTAQMSDKSVRMLESFGVFEIAVRDSKERRVDLARGQTARFDLPIPEKVRERAPQISRLFSFDDVTGRWIEEGKVVKEDRLVYSGTITRFDWSWNVDDPLDTTCITVKFVDVYGGNQGPIANALVEAQGVNYSTISSGYTNSQGLVCLLVKINSPVVINAYDPAYPTTPIGPVNVTSPNIVAGAGDCGDPVKCPLVASVEQDAE